MKKNIILVLLFCFPSLYAQMMLRTGIEGGLRFDHFSAYDQGSALVSKAISGQSFMFNVAWEIKPTIILETGFGQSSNYIGYIFQTPFGIKINDDTENKRLFSSSIIPLKMRNNINLWQEKLFLQTSAGFIWVNSPDKGLLLEDIGDVTVYANNIPVANVQYIAQTYKKHASYVFLNAGLGLEYQLKKRILFRLSAEYFMATQDIFHTEISYRMDKGSTTEAALVNRGNAINCSLGISYRFQVPKNKK